MVSLHTNLVGYSLVDKDETRRKIVAVWVQQINLPTTAPSSDQVHVTVLTVGSDGQMSEIHLPNPNWRLPLT